MHDLRLLAVLREVALRGSFSAAAEALAYTQPAVSQQIARLEKQVGVKLIEREPRGIRLTPAGEVLVRHTERVLAQLAAADEELQEVAARRAGACASARSPPRPARRAARGRRLPQACAPRSRSRSRCSSPRSRSPPCAAATSRSRSPRRAASPATSAPRGLEVEHLLDDHMWVSLPADHPLATRRAVELAELRDEDWMFACLTGTCADSNVVLRACQDAGFQPRIAYQSDDYFAIQGLVASGMGVALIPGLGLASTRDDVAVRPVKGRPPYAASRRSPLAKWPAARSRRCSNACATPARSTPSPARRRRLRRDVRPEVQWMPPGSRVRNSREP